MNRRRLLKRTLAGLGALAASGGAYAVWRRGVNPYYEGPVSDHFDGVRFFNPRGEPQINGFSSFLRWQAEGGRATWPDADPAGPTDKPPARVEGESLRVSYVGHASLLVQTGGVNLLCDPVWCERASPVQFAGPKRVNPPGIAFEDLPPIDAVLVSHNHYDHLCLDTLSRLHQAHRPPIIVPLGNDGVIRSVDAAVRVEAHDWGATVAVKGVRVHLEPAHHWSARGALDRRMALWAAFVVEGPGGKVYVVGDSGYNRGAYFRAAQEKHGPFRLAVLPIGAYEPRWFMRAQHMNPDEAVRAMRDCGAAHAMAHHSALSSSPTRRSTSRPRTSPSLSTRMACRRTASAC